MKEILNSKKLFSKSNIPNILTFARILLAPVVIVLLLCSKINDLPKIYHFEISNTVFEINILFLLGAIFFVIASITDWLDGYLARKNNWISDFGKLWDPIADKILINGVLISLGYLTIIPIWIPIIMISRDTIVDDTRMVAASKKIIIAANIYGKLKTVTQMIAIIVIIFAFNAPLEQSEKWFYWSIQNLFMFIALMFSIISGIIYEISFLSKQKMIKNS